MNPQTIRIWLIEKPRPVSLRLTCGDEQRLVNVGTNTFVKLASTVCALNPTLIEALDERGAVLRATQGDADELASEAPAKAPTGPQAMIDAGTLQLVAKLIAEAYKHSTETAFDRLADLFDSATRRSESLEKALASSERMRLREAEGMIAAGTGEGDGGIEGLIRSVLGGMEAGKATSASNGKAHS